MPQGYRLLRKFACMRHVRLFPRAAACTLTTVAFVLLSQIKEIEEQTALIARWKGGDYPEGKDVHDLKQQVRSVHFDVPALACLTDPA